MEQKKQSFMQALDEFICPNRQGYLFSVQRAIIYNGEQVEKWIDNCREFEKALDRSEVFRSVL